MISDVRRSYLKGYEYKILYVIEKVLHGFSYHDGLRELSV
jgi:hypothetical protein